MGAYSRCRWIVPTMFWRRMFLRITSLGLLVCAALPAAAAGAPAKVHVIGFGKWTSVQWFTGAATDEKTSDKTADKMNIKANDRMNDKALTIKIRTLVVDGRVKEYTLGAPHDVTDRLFVVRRVFRVNDSLPEDSAPRWQWQRGGWLLVDRVTGRISPVVLPEFDAYFSSASWYRDYVAYCGVADDGKKTYAMVAQLSRHKPVLKKELAGAGVGEDAAPDSACPAPSWQRSPARVSFEAGGARETFAIRGHVVDLVNDAEEEEEAAK
jgi:hypothetical protein